MNAIEVRDLHRIFRATIGTIRRRTKEVTAVDGISFDVQEGELFGLLGPVSYTHLTLPTILLV